MKAEDTVLSPAQRDNIFYRGIGTLEGVCKLQAEISFKLRTGDIIRQLNEFNQRGLTITEAIALLK